MLRQLTCRRVSDCAPLRAVTVNLALPLAPPPAPVRNAEPSTRHGLGCDTLKGMELTPGENGERIVSQESRHYRGVGLSWRNINL